VVAQVEVILDQVVEEQEEQEFLQIFQCVEQHQFQQQLEQVELEVVLLKLKDLLEVHLLLH
jgi:hypothetical protein